jgi:hypothetical protein
MAGGIYCFYDTGWRAAHHGGRACGMANLFVTWQICSRYGREAKERKRKGQGPTILFKDMPP